MVDICVKRMTMKIQKASLVVMGMVIVMVLMGMEMVVTALVEMAEAETVAEAEVNNA